MKCVAPFSSGWSPLFACWTASARHRLASSRRSRALRSPQLSQVPSPRTSPEEPHAPSPSLSATLTAHRSPLTFHPFDELQPGYVGMTVTPAAAAAVVVSAAALPLRHRGGSLTSSRAHPDLSSALLARCSPLELEGWSKVPVAATETRPLSDFYPGAPSILFAVSVSGWPERVCDLRNARLAENYVEIYTAHSCATTRSGTAALPPSSKTAAVA